MEKEKEKIDAEKNLRKEEKKKRNAENRAGLLSDVLQLFRDIFGRRYTEKDTDFVESRKTDKHLNNYLIWNTAAGTKKHSAYSAKEWLAFFGTGIVLAHVITVLILYVTSFTSLRDRIVTNNPLYLVPAIILPFVLWVFSTNLDFFAFHRRKRLQFLLCVINAFVTALQPVYSGVWHIIVPIIIKIKPNPVLTTKMILLLGYIGILAIFSAICILLFVEFEPLLLSATLKRQIEVWKYEQVHDSREDKDQKYDITDILSLETGEPVRIKERDRFLHILLNGASGTGKTSTIFMNVNKTDMDRKLANKELRQEAFVKMIKDGKATLKGPLTEFSESAIIPLGKSEREYEKNRKEIERIKEKYPDIGITIVAPNPDLITDIIQLAGARGFNVNVIDPVGSYANKYDNVKEMSLNPFYLPFDLSEEERVIYVTNAAMVFSDVLIATNNSGEGDPYFTDISLAVSSNIAAVIMLAKNIKGEQAYIDDVQECISDFTKLQPYVNDIEAHYNISVAGTAPSAPKKSSAIMGDDLDSRRRGERKKSGKGNPYYYQLLFVKQELLGAGAEDMFSQARGLRNLINKILQDPRIRTKLSAREDEERLDFDKIMANNEITVVNTAISLGKSISTSFGLFFILLHRVAVLRRPKATRTMHSLQIDEATQYMHPVYEDIISVYRQYKIAAMITLQSLTQTEKTRATAYLKNIFLGAGTQIVFGRLSPEEMKIYSEMGGIVREMQEQKSVTQNDIFASSPTYSESTRYTPTVTNILEGGDMRNLDFLELTIFTVDAGRVLPGQLGRVFFIGRDSFDKQKYRTVLWEKLVPEAFMPEEEEEDIFLTMDVEEDEQLPESTVILTQSQKSSEIEQKGTKEMSLADMFAMLNRGENLSLPEEEDEKEPAATQPATEQEPAPEKPQNTTSDYFKKVYQGDEEDED